MDEECSRDDDVVAGSMNSCSLIGQWRETYDVRADLPAGDGVHCDHVGGL